jgi:Ni/Co efflux regulator RcnB
MGMFDDIIVPKSYLRNLLSKENEKLLASNHSFQTKSFDNVMDVYKIHRKYLYKLNRVHLLDPPPKDEKWVKVNNSIVANFCDLVKDGDGNEYLFEFEFTFKKGWLDKKELVACKIQTTVKERKAIDEMWDIEQEILDSYRGSSVKYKVFSFLEKVLQKATNWARGKHYIPFELRKEAYEKSGRLKIQPDALDLYKDQ